MSLIQQDSCPYAIAGTLGRGGMGVVYRASHRETGVAAAIKTALNADPHKLSQIRQEIHALARLRHPGVVQILDQGVSEGQPWYAMELLEGETLRNVFRGYWREYATGSDAGPSADGDETAVTLPTMDSLSGNQGREPATGAMSDVPRPEQPLAAGGRLTEALSIAQRLCDALAYIHGEGVVHRDVKPSNIFVRESGLPVLVDFGLITHAGGTTGREVIGTFDRVAGSTAYMAPEQIRGIPLDARCDLYALGCVLYELITGRPPYVGTRDQVIDGHLRGVLLPPSAVADGVPEELDSLLAGLLEHDRDRRLGYAEDVGRRLEELGAIPPSWGCPLPASHPYLYHPAFIGRSEIVAELDARLAEPIDGKGTLVIVSAESGAGKTRLALEVSRRARRSGIRVISGECISVSGNAEEGRGVQGAPLHPLNGLMDAVVDACLEGGEKFTKGLFGERAAVLAAYFPAVGHLPGHAQLPAPMPMPAEAARKRLFEALTDTLDAFTAGSPTLLVLDDLQWADELTLGLIAHLSEGRLARMSLMVLGTMRCDEANDRVQGLACSSRCSRLTLGRMSRGEIGRMVGGMLALGEPPASFVDFLTAKSEGNPFFVAEYLRVAVAEHVLVRDDAGHWCIADTDVQDEALFESLPLPHSLRQMVELRLRHLAPESHAVVQAAAVMGRLFDIDIVREVLGIDEQQMLAALDEMVRRQIIEAGDDGGFRFIHDKLHEIPAARLEEEERRSLHRRIAQAIQARFDNSTAIETHRAALGLHWSRGGVPERAAPELILAADRAQTYNAVDEAIRLYKAALDEIAAVRHASVGEERHWREQAVAVEEKLGDILALTGRHAAARDTFDRADGEAPAEALVTRARLRRKSGKTWETQHRHEEALADYALADHYLDQATEDVRDSPWRREWIQVALNRIWVHYWRVDVDEMNTELARVQPFVADHGLPLHRYHYYMSIALRDYRQHRYRVSRQTLEDGRRMLAAAQESRQPPEIAFAHFVLGFGLLFAGELADAEAHLSEALESCRRIGDVSGEARATAYLVLCHRRLGRVAQCRDDARLLLQKAAAQDMQDYVGVAHAALAWSAYRGDDEGFAREEAKQALEIWKGLSFPYPFKWSGALTLLRLQIQRAPLGQLVELARLMREPEQMHLPDGIDSGLAKAVAARESGDYDRVRVGLADAVAAAEREGFL